MVIVSFEPITFFVKLVFLLTCVHCMSLPVIFSVILLVIQSSLKLILQFFTVSHFLKELIQDDGIIKNCSFPGYLQIRWTAQMPSKIPIQLHFWHPSIGRPVHLLFTSYSLTSDLSMQELHHKAVVFLKAFAEGLLGIQACYGSPPKAVQRTPAATVRQNFPCKSHKNSCSNTNLYSDTVWVCRDGVRTARAHLELLLARNVKDSKNSFYKCISSRRKRRENVGPQLNRAGGLVTKDTEETKVLGTFFLHLSLYC